MRQAPGPRTSSMTSSTAPIQPRNNPRNKYVPSSPAAQQGGRGQSPGSRSPASRARPSTSGSRASSPSVGGGALGQRTVIRLAPAASSAGSGDGLTSGVSPLAVARDHGGATGGGATGGGLPKADM